MSVTVISFDALVKSTAVFVIGIHTHNVPTKFLVELQHLVIDLDGCLDLTSTVALTEFFYPVLIIWSMIVKERPINNPYNLFVKVRKILLPAIT